MSASLSLVLASALTASAGVSSPSYPIRDTAEATADSSRSYDDSLHPTYVVRSNLHDVWEENSRKEKPIVDEFDYDSAYANNLIERSVSRMDQAQNFFLGNYSGFTSKVENANLYQPWGMLDTDFYTFSLYADSEVSISCDAEAAMDGSGKAISARSFDFVLYGLAYGAHSGDTYEKEIKALFSKTDESVSFSGLFMAGTYYIKAAHSIDISTLESLQNVTTDDDGNHYLQNLHVYGLTFYYNYNPLSPFKTFRTSDFGHYHTCWKKDYAEYEKHEFGLPSKGSDGNMYASCIYCHHKVQVYSANTGNPIGTLPVIDIPGGGVKTC